MSSPPVDSRPKLDFTIAIPTYNGAPRLPAVLDRLRDQTGLGDRQWEIIVVDNNSQDDTTTVALAYQAQLPENCTLRCLTETRQGAAFARQTAVAQAQSDLIGFLDDDNLPDVDWIAAAIAFAATHPTAGAIGSHIDPNYEIEPPPEFERIQPFLAIVNLGAAPRLYDRRTRLLPPSAGLVVRKTAWLASVPDRPILTGRTATSMLTGEDLEVLAHIQAQGWEIWHNPAMHLTHAIPRWRLQRDYLIPFMQGTGLSRHVTRMLSLEPWQRPFFVIAFWLSDLRRLLVHVGRYGRRSRTDLIPACETAFLLHCLRSPFYIWWQLGWQNRPPNGQRQRSTP